MTIFYVFWKTRTAMVNFSYLVFELNAVGECLAWANFRPIGVPLVTIVNAKTLY